MPNNNAKFLAAIDSESRAEILSNIAKTYGISVKAAHEVVTSETAEHLLDYMVEPQRAAASLLMQVHNFRGY